MDEMDILLNALEAEAASGNYTVLASYEEEEAYEIENFLVNNQQMNKREAGKLSRVAIKNPVLRSRLRDAMKKNSGRGAMKIDSGVGSQPVMAAQFDIIITRNTGALNVTLPIAVFGAVDSLTGYRNILNLPAGITLTSVRFGENVSQPNALRFSFTDGVDTDTVDVTCSQYPYPAFIEALKTDVFRLSKLRYQLSDSTQTVQLSQEHAFVQTSMFGTQKRNTMPVGAFKRPDQFQNGIIDIDGEFTVDRETSLRMGIIDVAAPPFSVTLSAFVEKFYRQNGRGF